ncbi:ribonuclease H-like domain-containing protein [Tanacetum coccineum]
MAREAAFKSTRVVHANVRQATPAWTNSNRVNKANQFTPRPVQLNNIRPNLSTASKTIKTGRVNVNTGHGNVSSVSSAGTQFKSGASRFNTGKQHVNSGSVHVNSGTQFKSGASRFNTGKQHVSSVRVNRPVSNNTSPKPSQVNLNSPKKCFSKQRSPVNRPFSRHTAYKSNIYAVKGKVGTAVKTSAGCVWRKTTPLSNTNSGPTPDSNVNDHPLKHMEHRGIFDSGCSGHMTGNRAHLEDYQELSKVGSVTFGGSKGSISGKGTIRLGNLVFDDVAFVKELGHFNLFSISQICDKKLNVLFTEKECFVVSSDFIVFTSEAVNTACYTFNRVRVTKPQNKTPYELLFGHKPILSYIRPFGCHVTILNTLSPLGKFDEKSDEGFLVGYSVNSKAFRVYNLVTKRVEVNLHVNFLEEKPNVQGIGHRWMFDLDYLSDSMNYIPVSMHNQANPAGSKEVLDIDVQTEEAADLMVVSSSSLTEATRKAAVSEKIATKKTHSPKQPSSTPISKSADDIMTFRKELDALALKHLGPVPATAPTSTNPVNTGSINLNTAFEKVTTGNTEAISPSADHEEEVFSDADDDEMPEIRIYDKSSEGIFEKASYDDDGIISDFNNLPDEEQEDEEGVLTETKQGPAISNELSMGELTFFLVYKSSITRKEDQVPLTKDEEAFDVDVTPKKFSSQCCQGGSQEPQGSNQTWIMVSRGITPLIWNISDSDNGGFTLTGNPQQGFMFNAWSAIASTKEDGFLEISATIDTIRYTITEASIRESLQLDDATGITMLPNDDLFQGMGQIGYPTDGTFTFWKSFFTPQWRYLVHHLLHCISSKSGGWDQFGSNIATALICLSTGRVYNFSKLIFDGMMANLKNKKKFLMYPRFLQIILNIQTENKHPYLAVSLTKKIFGNMKRGFQGAPRPLLPSMLLVATNPIAGQEHAAQAQSQPLPPPPPIPSPTPTPIPTSTSPPPLIPSPTPTPIPTPTSPPPPPETEPTTDEYLYEKHSPVHHHFSPSQEQAPSRMPMDDLLHTVPKLISRIDSLELDLKQTKKTMGKLQ